MVNYKYWNIVFKIISVLIISEYSYAGSFNCEKSFFKLVSNIWNSGHREVKTWQEVKSLSSRPEKILIKNPQIGTTEGFSEMGYIQDYQYNKNKKNKMHFIREHQLVSDQELPPLTKSQEELFLQQQKNFISQFGKSIGSLNASNREKYFAETPEYDHLLTIKTLQKIKPGWYSFVVLKGENFIRLGVGHTMLGARMPVLSAGEVMIGIDSATNKNMVIAFNPRSDTYRPMPSELLPAMEVLWRQGIISPILKIFAWDKHTLLLELKDDPPKMELP